MCRNLWIQAGISSAGVVVGQRTDIVIRFFSLLMLVLMVSAWPPGAEAAEPYPDPASEMWLEVRESADPKLLESFIEAFPDSPYAHAARARLERLKAGPAAAETPPDGEESFIITYPAPGTAPTPPPATTAPASGAAPQTAPAAPAAPAPTVHAVGSSFRDTLSAGGEGPEMVVIPAGRFRMGSLPGAGYDNEKPVHEVAIARPFALSKYEVTFADYDRFTHPNKVDDEAGAAGGVPSSTFPGTMPRSMRRGCPQRRASVTAWRRRRSGSMRRGPGALRNTVGGMTSAVTGPTVIMKTVATSGSTLRRQGVSLPMPGACTTCTATCGNGCRIAGMTAMRARRLTAAPGPVASAAGAWFGAVPGTVGPGFLRAADRCRYTRSFRSYGIGFRLAQDL